MQTLPLLHMMMMNLALIILESFNKIYWNSAVREMVNFTKNQINYLFLINNISLWNMMRSRNPHFVDYAMDMWFMFLLFLIMALFGNIILHFGKKSVSCFKKKYGEWWTSRTLHWWQSWCKRSKKNIVWSIWSLNRNCMQTFLMRNMVWSTSLGSQPLF